MGYWRFGRQLALCIAVASGLALAHGVAHADWTAAGSFLYTDRVWDRYGFTGELGKLPIRFAHVEIRDAVTEAVLGSGGTDSRGRFRIAVRDSLVRDVYARVFTYTEPGTGYNIEVIARYSVFSSHSYYSFSSDVFPDHPPDYSVDLPEPLVATLERAGAPFNILDCVEEVADHMARVHGGRSPQRLISATWYFEKLKDPNFRAGSLALTSNGAYDDMRVQAAAGAAFLLGYAESGFTINPSSQERAGGSTVAAWLDGWGKFVVCSMLKANGATLPNLFIRLTRDGSDLAQPKLEDVEGPARPLRGAADGLAVASALWDLTDDRGVRDLSPGSDDDSVSVPAASLWEVAMYGVSDRGDFYTFCDSWVSHDLGHRSALDGIARSIGTVRFPDSYENDNSRLTATVIGVNQAGPPHTLYPLGDTDWYRFEAVAGRDYVIEPLDLMDGCIGGLDVYPGVSQDPVASLDRFPRGDDDEPRIVLRAASTGPYYIRCSLENFEHRGGYSLRVAETTPIADFRVLGRFLKGPGRYGQRIKACVEDGSGGLYAAMSEFGLSDSVWIAHMNEAGVVDTAVSATALISVIEALARFSSGELYWISTVQEAAGHGVLYHAAPGGPAVAVPGFSATQSSQAFPLAFYGLTASTDGGAWGSAFSLEKGTVLFHVGSDGAFGVVTSLPEDSGLVAQIVPDAKEPGTAYVLTEVSYSDWRLLRIDLSGHVSRVLRRSTAIASMTPAETGGIYGIGDNEGAEHVGLILHVDATGEIDTLGDMPEAIGAAPQSLFRASDGIFYGCNAYGPRYEEGTVFSFTPGGGFSIVHAFQSTNGAFQPTYLFERPDGGLVGIAREATDLADEVAFLIPDIHHLPGPAVTTPTALATGGGIQLKWSCLTAPRFTSRVLRSANEAGPFEELATLDGGGAAIQQYEDRGTLPNRDYFYQIAIRSLGSVDEQLSVTVHAHTNPAHVSIHWPVPNPTPGPTQVYFELSQRSTVHMDLFDVQGRRVASPPPQIFDPGRRTVSWDGRGVDGQRVGAGVYFLRIVAGETNVVRRLVIIR